MYSWPHAIGQASHMVKPDFNTLLSQGRAAQRPTWRQQIFWANETVLQLYSGKWIKALICSTCPFPWYKHSHNCQSQATNEMSRNAESGRGVCGKLLKAGRVWAGYSTALSPPHFNSSQLLNINWAIICSTVRTWHFAVTRARGARQEDTLRFDSASTCLYPTLGFAVRARRT